MKIFFAHSKKLFRYLLAYLAICAQVWQLDLSINRMTIKIPLYFSFFRDLIALIIDHNNPHAYLPQPNTNLTMLHVLDLFSNKFSGRISYHLERLFGFVINASNDYRL